MVGAACVDPDSDRVAKSGGSARPRVRRGDVVALAIIMVVGLLLRFAYWTEHRDAPDTISPGLDAGFHHYWATGLATGAWPAPVGHDDPQVQTTPFFRPPGYPYFLSLIYRVTGPSIPAAMLVQAALGMVAVVLAFVLARGLVGRAGALVVAAGMSWYWALIYFEQELLDATLLVVLGLLLLLSLRSWPERLTWRRAILSGVLLGIFALTRPNVLLFGLVVVVWGWWLLRKRETPGPFAAALIGFPLAAAVAIAPATIRNYVVAREFVLISSNGGINLHIGNNTETDCVWPAIPELEELTGKSGWTCFDQPLIVRGVSQLEGRPMSHAEVSSYFAGKALRYIVQHPIDVMRLTAKKAILFWGPAEISNNKEIAIERARSTVLSANAPFALVFSLAVVGLIIGARWPRGPSNEASPMNHSKVQAFRTVIVWFVVVYFASFLPFFVASRYRVPLLPYVFLPAAYALCRIGAWAWVGRWDRVGVGAGGAIAVLMGVLAIGRIEALAYAPRESSYHHARGAAWSRLTDWQRASEAYRRAVELDPERRDSRRSLANTLYRAGRLDEAKRELELLLAEDESAAEVHNLFAAVLADQGRTEQAIAHYYEALRLRPDYYEARHNFAVYLMGIGRIDAALTEFDLLATLAPNDPSVWYKYGIALREAGRIDESNARLARAAALDPALTEELARMGVPLDAPPPPIEPPPITAQDESDVRTLRQRAGRAAAVGRFGQAVDLLRQALAIAPDDPAVHHQLAGALVDSGRPADAVPHYRRVLDKHPDVAIFHLELGSTYKLLEDAESAAKHYREAVRLEPDMLEAHYNLGTVLEYLGRIDEALAAMKRAGELAPRSDRADLSARIEERITRLQAAADNPAAPGAPPPPD